MMKTTLLALTLMLPTSVLAADMQAKFTNPFWDGITVPEGQQCNRFGGKAMTPEIEVSNIAPTATSIFLQFDDRSYKPMNFGGHGVIRYIVKKGVGKVTIPSVPAHTYQLPKGFLLVKGHAGADWDTKGAYLPPCSGGRGNEYVLVVKAYEMDGFKQGHQRGKVELPMGRY